MVQRPATARFLPNLHPVLARVYAARHVASSAELEHTLELLQPPGLLKGMEAAVDLLARAIRNGLRLLIVADFDADGATSCALALRALRAMGAREVQFVVPNRFEYGYGLTPEIVAVAAQYQPDVLITVDNGISSIEGVQAAKALGMQVLITDHHLPAAELPLADAIVNPNQPGDDFPSKHLAGVGVIFYVMLALRSRLRSDGWFDERSVTEPNLARLLDLVALGTVADVVPLDHNNRILVAQGLKRINQGQACPGILALLKAAGRKPGRLAAADLGFVVAPRLNAAGRLTDMSLGIECLLTDSESRAQEIALELDRLNRDRRAIESEMQNQALAIVQELHLGEHGLPAGVCLFDPAWHQGVIGILAARIRERVHRPVIAFAPATEFEIKGSARSVPGLHIRDVLDAVAARHPGLVSKFGGHAMAAGLSLPQTHFDGFQKAFAEEVARHLDEEDLHGEIHSDGTLAADDLTLNLAQQLRAAGPWGQGFPEPMFDGEFEVVNQRVVAEKHLKLYLRAAPGADPIEAIAFRALESATLPAWSRVRAAYRLDVNEYQGQRTVQLMVEYLYPM
ncbi:MAG TPA: single-stranded-DNA-specific exonuclease RecJ [Gammaproteobacteria bacterium]|nr:single-stranded-DNA-specific exonuclease RecJ [Gammaproteobacteria bacterium]